LSVFRFRKFESISLIVRADPLLRLSVLTVEVVKLLVVKFAISVVLYYSNVIVKAPALIWNVSPVVTVLVTVKLPWNNRLPDDEAS